MSPQARSDMVELSFEVPDRLIGQIYIAIGEVLQRALPSTTAEQEPELHDWGTEAFDDERAPMAWRKFSPRAQAVFALLMENPGVAMQADEIAVKIGLANGRHGLAGVVAWPSRQCAEMGLTPPFRYESPPAPGETGSYWMDPETAQLFIAARERSLAMQADIHPQS
jgi:Family of unknown function (DUF6416)